MKKRGGVCVLAALGAAMLLLAASPRPAARGVSAAPQSIVLLTLDTTRADVLGVAGGAARTPALDALARAGTRWQHAIAPAPITLPSHVSLLTGLDPPAHGVRDNGLATLPAAIPTLAERLLADGYSTAAFVSSRVLDRRFGLARGFAVYDDRMAAERIGEYGYPERDAKAVTDAALSWARAQPAGTKYFLWVHYYDPHSPYAAPVAFGGASAAERYAGEVGYMDSEIGRLLAGLPGDASRRLVAAVGDHGEMLGEHGERAHGIFLYRAALDVPLIVAGPGVPRGRVVRELAGARGLAATLLRLAGAGRADGPGFGAPLPGIFAGSRAAGVYSEASLPATAYGWSPLSAWMEGRLKLVVAPRVELYDVVADPGEVRNLLDSRRDDARRMKRAHDAHLERIGTRAAPTVAAGGDVGAALRSLGYLSGSSAGRGPAIDPKDGIALLAKFDEAKEQMDAGRAAEAERTLAELVERNPGNVPFRTQLARARMLAGKVDEAIATYRSAVELNPALDFLHLQLADAYRDAGKHAEARAEYELALRLNPRMAAPWLRLAELEETRGGARAARDVLTRGAAAGADSASLWTLLAQKETATGNFAAATRALEEAVRVEPKWAPAWLLLGESAELAGRSDEALQHYIRAAAADPRNPSPPLHAGKLLARRGDAARARTYLQRVVMLAPRSPEASEARRLLR